MADFCSITSYFPVLAEVVSHHCTSFISEPPGNVTLFGLLVLGLRLRCDLYCCLFQKYYPQHIYDIFIFVSPLLMLHAAFQSISHCKEEEHNLFLMAVI